MYSAELHRDYFTVHLNPRMSHVMSHQIRDVSQEIKNLIN